MNFEQFHRLFWSVSGCGDLGKGDGTGGGATPLKVSDGVVACPEDDERVCAICMLNSADIMLPCLHVFCNACISDWMKRSAHRDCPSCRAPIAADTKGDSDVWLVVDDCAGGFSYLWDEIMRNSKEI